VVGTILDRPGLHSARRGRVAAQVLSKWRGDDLDDEAYDAAMASVGAALDATYSDRVCDLDWEAAALRALEGL
jgi:hypothetical protein